MKASAFNTHVFKHTYIISAVVGNEKNTHNNNNNNNNNNISLTKIIAWQIKWGGLCNIYLDKELSMFHKYD